MMHRSRLLVAALLIALLIGIGFAISVPHASDLPQKHAAAPAPATVPVVRLSDTYKKGVHTLTGSLIAPDACTSVSAVASLVGDASTSQEIALALSMPPDTGTCLELATPSSFSTTLSAPAGLPIRASVNGTAASTTPP